MGLAGERKVSGGRELSVREEGAMDWDLEELERGGSSDRWGVC
jgi:hypothetical protein